MPFYYAYGLKIQSDLVLPELESSDAGAQVFVRLGRVDGIPVDSSSQEYYSNVTADEVRYYWREAGRFLIRAGREIVIEPASGVDERVLRLTVLGPALAFLLYQRGLLILHSSAIAASGKAVAFLAEAGGGKSSTAAAFLKHGYNVVADDVVAVRLDLESPIVFPSFPRLKLWPEIAMWLGDDLASLPELHPDLPKRGRLVSASFSRDPLPLQRIYVLAEGDTSVVEPLAPQATVVELVRHSYGVRMLQSLDPGAHFLQCADLARRVPVKRLQRPISLDSLPATVRAVEQDLAIP